MCFSVGSTATNNSEHVVKRMDVSHNVVGIALIKNIENGDDVSYRLAQSISEHAGTANEG